MYLIVSEVATADLACLELEPTDHVDLQYMYTVHVSVGGDGSYHTCTYIEVGVDDCSCQCVEYGTAQRWGDPLNLLFYCSQNFTKEKIYITYMYNVSLQCTCTCTVYMYILYMCTCKIIHVRCTRYNYVYNPKLL